jgi:hypothetical protein
MKPQLASPRLFVPEGFSGWWCDRCEKPVAGIPDEAGSPAKCPHCRKWTVQWIPPAAPDLTVRELKAGAPWERQMPTACDAKRLFEHVRQVIENPDLEPDLRKIDEEAAKR